MNYPKILVIDIETAPHIAYVWGAWKQNIGFNMFKENGYIMSVAAKWLYDDETFYFENRRDNEEDLLKGTFRLLREADLVIAHNAKRFDIPTLFGRAAALGMSPPAPFKVVDTLEAAKKAFRLPYYSLEYLCELFDVDNKKVKHTKFPGFELWLECLKQNDEAWEEMQTYNRMDVWALEEVYLKMLPWITNHPNIAANMEDDKPRCPKCGHGHINYRGYYHTNAGKYRRFVCIQCGGWSRSRYTELDNDKRKNLLANAI